MRKVDFLKNTLKYGVLSSNLLNSNAMESNYININTAINTEFNKIINSKDNSENLIGIGNCNKLCKINLNNKTWLVTYNKQDNEEDNKEGNKVDFKIKKRFTPNYIASNEILRYFLNSPQPEIINIGTQEFIKGTCLPFEMDLFFLLDYKHCDEKGIPIIFDILNDLKKRYPEDGTEGRYGLTIKDYENSINFLTKLTDEQKNNIIEKEICRNMFFKLPDDGCSRNCILVPDKNSYNVSYIDLDGDLRTGESFIKEELNYFIGKYNLNTGIINKWITDILKDKDPKSLSGKIEENILKVFSKYEGNLSMDSGFIQLHNELCYPDCAYKEIYNINQVTKLTIKDSIDYCTKSFEGILNCKDLKLENLDGNFLLNNTEELLEKKIEQFKDFLKKYEEENKDILNSFQYVYE